MTTITGKQCKKCGGYERYIKSGKCSYCMRKYQRERTKKASEYELLEEENKNLRAALGDETLIKHIIRLEGQLKDCRRKYQIQADYHLTFMESLKGRS